MSVSSDRVDDKTYREGTNGGSGELGQVELLLLDLLANSEWALTVEHVRGDCGNPLPDSIIGSALELTTLGDGGLVGLICRGNLGILRARDHGSDSGHLTSLLKSECEPVLLLSSKFVLSGESDGRVEEGRGRGNDDTISTDSLNSLLAKLDSGLDIGLPDVTT